MTQELLEQTFYGNTMAAWLTALGVTAAVMIGLRALVAIVVRRLRAISERTRNDLDDLAVELLHKTRFLFILIVGAWAGSLTLDLSATADDWIREILVVGLLLQGAFWTTGLVNYWLGKFRKRQVEEDPGAATALGALGFVARLAVWVAFLLLALQNLGIEITAVIAGLGIGGLAVALALQNVLGDLFASLSIVLDKPFVIGDFVIVGDFMGTVEHVGLKTTRIRSLSGEQLVFSNSDLLSSRIRNYRRMNERRILFSFGVVYGTPAEDLEAIPGMVREIVEARELTRFDRSHFKSYGASSLDFETVYFMLVPDYNTYMDTQEKINLEIYRRFADRGIEFAFPTRTVHVESMPASSSGG